MRVRSRFATLLLVPILVVSGLPSNAGAAPPRGYSPPKPQSIPAVPTKDVPPVGAAPTAQAPAAAPAVTWPAAGSATVTMPSALAVARGAAPVSVPVPGTPLALESRSSSPSSVTVSVLDHDRARRAGVTGLLARIAAPNTTTPGSVGVAVDYTGFGSAYGGDWAGRMQLAVLPDCALTDPAGSSSAATRRAPTT